jgi:hypothetical protein
MRPLLFCLVTLFYLKANAATIYARSDGDWDNPSTWSTSGVGGGGCGCTPGNGDNVIIDGYDVLIDIGTGNITINSLIIRSDTRDDNSYLRVEDGMVLTITDDLTIFGNRALRSQTLEMRDNNSRISIGDDFIIDQNLGTNIIIDIEFNTRINVGDDLIADKDGGEDIDFRLNESSGTSATLAVASDFSMTVDNYDVDGVRFFLNGSSCQFNVGGNFTLIESTAANTNGSTLFDLNGGAMTITGSMNITRLDDCGDIDFDMDGGDLSANSVVINSGGTLGAATAVRFAVDMDSQMNVATSFSVTMTGGDDFFININENAGTTAQVNIGGTLTINRTDGDDIEITVDDDNSILDINGSLTITSSGGEEILIDLNNNGIIDIAGNLSISHTQGQEVQINLEGAGDLPNLRVGSNFILNMLGGGDNANLTVAGGTMAIGANWTITQGTGASDINLAVDGSALITVGANFITTLSGGDDISFGFGENTTGSTAKLDVAGEMQMTHNFNNAGALMRLRIFDNCEVEAAGVSLSQNFTAPALFLVELDNNAILDVDGNLTFNAAGGGEVEVRISNTSKMELTGNVIRGAAPNKFGKINCLLGGTIEFNGTSAQIIPQNTANGSDFVSYNNVIINNSSATAPQLTMEGAATVTNNIDFIDGIIATTTTNILTLIDGATATSASNASYVDGPVRKIGDDDFAFPVGDGDNYRPIGYFGPANTTDAFDAQYFETDPSPSFTHTSKAAAINHISRCEYWTLNRSAGTSALVMALTWDVNSCGVSNLADLLVARWNGTQWVSHGNGGTIGNTTTGAVFVSAPVTAFSPFTLASGTTANPLPVTLTKFSGTLEKDLVKLKWQTASELNCDFFEVERSQNGEDWTIVGKVKGQGTKSGNTDYDLADNKPYYPLTYYRLKQTDFGGNATYFDIIYVELKKDQVTGLENIHVYPNPAKNIINIDAPGLDHSKITLVNTLGQIVQIQPENLDGKIRINTSGLEEGIYFLKIENGGNLEIRVLAIEKD